MVVVGLWQKKVAKQLERVCQMEVNYSVSSKHVWENSAQTFRDKSSRIFIYMPAYKNGCWAMRTSIISVDK